MDNSHKQKKIKKNFFMVKSPSTQPAFNMRISGSLINIKPSASTRGVESHIAPFEMSIMEEKNWKGKEG